MRKAIIAVSITLYACGCEWVLGIEQGTVLSFGASTAASGASDTASSGVSGSGGMPVCDLLGAKWFEGTYQDSPVPHFDGEFDAFIAAVKPAIHLDFETRGDLITPVQAGVVVPEDEYASCCGVRLKYEGTDPTGQIIWAGNSQSGFGLRVECSSGPPPDTCTEGNHGIRVTFVDSPVSVTAATYPSNTTAFVYDVTGSLVANINAGQSGLSFLGYTSNVPLGSAVYTDGIGEGLHDLWYKRCF